MAATATRAKKAPKVVRRAVEAGALGAAGGKVPQVQLSVETLQLAHEALVQLRANNSQSMLAKAKAMNELEGIVAVMQAQQQVEETDDKVKALQETVAADKARADTAGKDK